MASLANGRRQFGKANQMDHVSSNRQAMADMAEIARIAREIEEKRNNNRVLDLDMRVMMLITEWMGGPYVKNPLRPLGPTLERARRAQRVSKLSTREIGRARRYFAGLIGRYADKPTAIREAFQERIAADDQQAAEALGVLELS